MVRIGAFDAETGNHLRWVSLGLPSGDLGPINAIVATDDSIYVGGKNIGSYIDEASRLPSNLLVFSKPNYSRLSVENEPHNVLSIIVLGNAAEQHLLQSSTNLNSWHSVATNNGTFIYETVPHCGRRFYRVLTP